MKKNIYLALIVSFFLILPIYSENDTDAYQIKNIEYEIKGITKKTPLSMAVPVNTDKIFKSKEELEEYINSLNIEFQNLRVIEKYNIKTELLEPSDGITPVNLYISVKDSWSIVAIPFPKFDSNSGFLFKLKIKDFNFAGLLTTLNSDIAYRKGNDNKDSGFLGFDLRIPFKKDPVSFLFDIASHLKFQNSFKPSFDISTGLNTSYKYKRVSINFGIRQDLNLYSINLYKVSKANKENKDKDLELNADKEKLKDKDKKKNKDKNNKTNKNEDANGENSKPEDNNSSENENPSNSEGSSGASGEGSSGTGTENNDPSSSESGGSSGTSGGASSGSGTENNNSSESGKPNNTNGNGSETENNNGNNNKPETDDNNLTNDKDKKKKEKKEEDINGIHIQPQQISNKQIPYYLTSKFYTYIDVDIYKTKKYGTLKWSPYISISKKWKFGKIYEDSLKGFDINFLQYISIGKINWIGNFRQGFAFCVNNSYFYNTYKKGPVNISFSTELKGYYSFLDRVAIYGRLNMYYNLFNAKSNMAGVQLRGIRDNRLASDTAFSVNLDLPIKIHVFEFDKITGIDWTKYLSFELHINTFFDMALTHDEKTQTYYNPKYGWYSGGFELHVYPLKLRSVYGRVSVGFDLREIKSIMKKHARAKRDGKPISEIFLGLGFLY